MAPNKIYQLDTSVPSTALVGQLPNQQGQIVQLDANGAVQVDLGASNLPTTDASTGATNANAPLFASEVGFVDNSGKLQAVSVTNPLPVSTSGSGSNAAAGPTGSAVPSSAGYTGFNVSGNLVGVSVSNPLPITGSISATNPSVSATGSAIPTSATLLGGSDGTNLQQLLVDGSKNLKTVVNAALPAGTNVIGHVIVDTAPTTAVTGTFFQATQPVSASSLPLPTGAATSAKQPALGTAGTASSDVVTVQGIASMTALKVDGSGVTQPVSGTVTANAGTNMSTASLALETGGNLATIAGAVSTSKVNVNLSSGSIPAGTNLIGEVSASNETSTIYNGTTALTPLFSTISASSSGSNTVVSATAGKRIRVLQWDAVATAAVSITWQTSTGPTALSGAYPFAANGGISSPFSPVGLFQTASGDNLVLNLGTATLVAGRLVYVLV